MKAFSPLARAGRVLLLMAALALGGCSAMWAQNPASPLKPVNAVADGGDAHVILFGHDVVAYFTDGHDAPGSQRFESLYEGVTFRFASAEHKALFDADPQRYIPQYGGYCADGITYGIPWGGSPDTWMIRDGRLYIFGGAAAKAAFMLDVAGNIALADKYWREEVQGSNSFWQRTKRLMFRVPHYKSDAELARLVREAAAKGS